MNPIDVKPVHSDRDDVTGNVSCDYSDGDSGDDRVRDRDRNRDRNGNNRKNDKKNDDTKQQRCFKNSRRPEFTNACSEFRKRYDQIDKKRTREMNVDRDFKKFFF